MWRIEQVVEFFKALAQGDASLRRFSTKRRPSPREPWRRRNKNIIFGRILGRIEGLIFEEFFVW
jgi:hypothetical protein